MRARFCPRIKGTTARLLQAANSRTRDADRHQVGARRVISEERVR